mmetsp:Transcript_40880/g.94123  ORF Transcript_40880/g.94123 Transcript_40880/m.94123 type:complete len:210 (-) Transcript_40880:329-958(-)
MYAMSSSSRTSCAGMNTKHSASVRGISLLNNPAGTESPYPLRCSVAIARQRWRTAALSNKNMWRSQQMSTSSTKERWAISGRFCRVSPSPARNSMGTSAVSPSAKSDCPALDSPRGKEKAQARRERVCPSLMLSSLGVMLATIRSQIGSLLAPPRRNNDSAKTAKSSHLEMSVILLIMGATKLRVSSSSLIASFAKAFSRFDVSFTGNL